MQITRSKTQYLPATILIVVWVLVWVCMASDAIAWYPAKYTESAHGDSSSGVNRSGTGYPIGSCAHCHDTFDDSICGVSPLMMFAPNNPTSQTDNFCFQCHKGSGAVQEGGSVTNNNYGSTFGGGTANSTNIKDAFNFGLPNEASTTGSSHNLDKMRSWLIANGAWLTTDTNACLACHDPHLAQQNTGVDPHPLFGGVKTAIRRTTDGATDTANQWGDEPAATSGMNEMMSDYTAKYQAPLRADSGYEPKQGSAITNGSNLPNFKNFCLVCHSSQISSSYTDVADPIPSGWHYCCTPGPICDIDWSTSGDHHGRVHHTTSNPFRGTKAPYLNQDYNYILACTDCHEPHGSPNEWLLRTSVNGVDNISIPEPGRWWHFCMACHYITLGEDGAHGFNFDETKDCRECHHHGFTHGF